MSTSTIRGKIQNFSPKPDEDYYGILVDTGKQENWFNGQGEVPEGLSKGDKVKIKVNKNGFGFIDVEDIEVVGSGSNQNSSGEGEGRSDKDGQRKAQGANHDSSNFISPEMQVCLKEAAETARSVDGLKVQDPEGGGEHIQLVSKLAHGYYRILQDLADENQGNGGER